MLPGCIGLIAMSRFLISDISASEVIATSRTFFDDFAMV
jgi:hypothetical protein